jgi:ApaG protein
MGNYKQVIFTTEGVTVSVVSSYEAEVSNSDLARFVFSYQIEITNNTPYTIKLTHREWEIIDGVGRTKRVEGEGVVGVQPIIEPGESFSYSSWCPLPTQIGNMSGYYTIERLIDKVTFKVKIPKFTLISLAIQN